jgi:sulfur-oxidizing protein SoxZ
MSKTSRTVVSMPKTATKGEIVPIRVIVQHDMESGFRHTERGVRVARDIIRDFVCSYDGVEVFRAELHPAMGANPTFSFFTRATQTGTLEFKWTGDNGYASSVTSMLTVT